MKISNLHIEKFRSIKNIDLNFSQINALVGQNNTGKSNILLALQKILGSLWVTVNTFEEEDVYFKDPEADIKISIDLEPALKYQMLKEANPVEIKTLIFNYTHYKIGERKGQRRLEKSCLDARGKSPVVLAKPLRKGERADYRPVMGIPQEILEDIPIIYIGMNRELKDQLPSNRYSLLRRLLEDVDKDFQSPKNVVKVKNENGGEVQLSKSDQFKKLIEQAMKLLRTDEFESLEGSIKKNALYQLGFDPVKDAKKLDFFFYPFSSADFYKSLKLFVKEDDFTIDATKLGGGFQNALVISILKAFEERKKQGAVFLIEEPEMYLHPQMQRSLYKTLREIGKTNQIIYTTHSPHFITIPEYNEIIRIIKNKNGTEKKVSSLSLDKTQKEKIRKELDPERNELFFAKKLLLVEGDTEKLVFPEYAKKFNIDLDNLGATIVEVGGKKSLLEIAKIAISFEIPTGIIYDEDSSDFKSDEKEKEQQYNKELESLKNPGASTEVWKFNKKYEDELKKFLGEQKYQKLCQKYSNYSPPIRQRLIAVDSETGIPVFVQPILEWLAK